MRAEGCDFCVTLKGQIIVKIFWPVCLFDKQDLEGVLKGEDVVVQDDESMFVTISGRNVDFTLYSGHEYVPNFNTDTTLSLTREICSPAFNQMLEQNVYITEPIDE